MDPLLIVALLAPAVSSVAAAVSKWRADRRSGTNATVTTVRLHDAHGAEVVLRLEGVDADEVARALESLTTETDQAAPPSPGHDIVE
jgi:ribosomal 30S subunit maturation factor RimM